MTAAIVILYGLIVALAIFVGTLTDRLNDVEDEAAQLRYQHKKAGYPVEIREDLEDVRKESQRRINEVLESAHMLQTQTAVLEAQIKNIREGKAYESEKR